MNKTPMYECHVEQKAMMAEFAGTLLPLRFSSEHKEYLATRTKAGMFDVSHMGEFLISGDDAYDFLQYMLSNDLDKLDIHQSQYTLLLNNLGGIIDDLIVYKLSPKKYLLCVNAGNISNDWHWLCEHAYKYNNLSLENLSDDYGQIALQGPNTFLILKILGFEKHLAKFEIASFNYLDKDLLIARTGYTGEEYGVEIFVPKQVASELWQKLLLIGHNFGLKPCGLSVRDCLRIEAGLLLWGVDMSMDTTPTNLGLMNFVHLSKNFIAKEALKNAQKTHSLIGFKMLSKAIARHGYQVFDTHGQFIGHVTSGTFIADKNLSIGFAYINNTLIKHDDIITIQIRNQSLDTRVCKKSFLK